jgi:hypothetical protein
VPDVIRPVEARPDISLAVGAEPTRDRSRRIERCTGNRRIRYRDVAIRSVEVEEVDDSGILAGCDKDPVCADGGELTEVPIASGIVEVERPLRPRKPPFTSRQLERPNDPLRWSVKVFQREVGFRDPGS